jgi:hypothetical protein
VEGRILNRVEIIFRFFIFEKIFEKIYLITNIDQNRRNFRKTFHERFCKKKNLSFSPHIFFLSTFCVNFLKIK